MHIINVAHAGVISDAPSISSIGMRALFFLLSVAGIIAIIALVVAATMYLTAYGNEKQMQDAKTYVQYCVIGIVVIMSAMVLINFIGQFFRN